MITEEDESKFSFLRARESFLIWFYHCLGWSHDFLKDMYLYDPAETSLHDSKCFIWCFTLHGRRRIVNEICSDRRIILDWFNFIVCGRNRFQRETLTVMQFELRFCYRKSHWWEFDRLDEKKDLFWFIIIFSQSAPTLLTRSDTIWRAVFDDLVYEKHDCVLLYIRLS